MYKYTDYYWILNNFFFVWEIWIKSKPFKIPYIAILLLPWYYIIQTNENQDKR